MPDIIVDKFRLIRTLGAGGMGTAWLAEHNELHSRVILKTIRFNNPQDKDATAVQIERFRREGLLAASARNRHLVRVYDWNLDRAPDAVPIGPYIAMEYVDGPTLAAYDPPDLLDFLRLASEIADGLFYLHDTIRSIHRDLKPENVFLDQESTLNVPSGHQLVAKIGDFGIARSLQTDEAGLTGTALPPATLLWAAPEQLQRGAVPDVAGDLYAFGLILWYFLAGKQYPPAVAAALHTAEAAAQAGDRDQHWEAMRQLRAAKGILPPPPSGSNAAWSIPPELDDLVLRLLAPDPTARPGGADEVFRQLNAIRTGLQQTVVGPPAPPSLAQPTLLPRSLPRGRHLAPVDLMLARTPAGVRELFRLLGYETRDGTLAVAEGLAFSPANITSIGNAYWLADYTDLQILLFEVADLTTPALRRLVLDLLRRGGNYFVVAAHVAPGSAGEPQYDQLVLLCPQRVGRGLQATPVVRLHRLAISTARPTRHALDVLERIALLPPDPTVGKIWQRMLDAFNVEKLTQRFYKEYAALYKRVMAGVRAQNLGRAAFNDPGEVRGFVQRLLGRIMFLYFLQHKGWLAADPNFLTTQYRLAEGRKAKFYGDWLVPLFFDTLARREADRNTDPSAGPVWRETEIPYLNGGLFEIGVGQDYERDLSLTLDNALFSPDLDGGILEFFNSYSFTVEEDTPLDAAVALDPEMLGKVFENLLEEDERGASGTFYTPRAIVHFITRRLLTGYLLDALAAQGISMTPAALLAHFDAAYDDLALPHLPRAAANAIETALRNLRALDPAVGSGAFPVGLLGDMVAMQRAVYRARGVDVPVGSGQVAHWKREFIADCLYGVDIKPAAIDIAKLRLWLSLVVDVEREQADPLPNLDYKMMVGDSLLETVNGRPLSALVSMRPGVDQGMFALDERAAILREFEQLRDALFDFEGSPDEKRARKTRLLELERQLLTLALAEQREDLLVRERTMLGAANWATESRTAKARKTLTDISSKLDVLAAMQQGMVQEGRRPIFLYRLHFSDVFRAKGGFDLVLGNPPYVRQEALGKAFKDQLVADYPAVGSGTADLYVYFYARGFGLLRPGGRLGFITSNKFFRAEYGAKLRQFFAERVRLDTVLDFGDLPIFEATTYPAIVIGAKRATVAAPDVLTATTVEILRVHSMEALTDLEKYVTNHAQIRTQAEGIEEGDINVDTLLMKVKSAGQALDQYTGVRFYRGVTTGYNTAFEIDADTRNRLITEDPKSAELIKPYLRGKDVRRYKITYPNLYIIFTRRGVNIDDYPGIKSYLNQFREDLEPKTSTTQKRGRKPGNYQWYEVQDVTAYYTEFDKEKIAYAKTANRSEFAMDPGGWIFNNQVYFILSCDRYLLGLLNSKLLEFYFPKISGAIRGGYVEYITRFVEQLPIATPTPAQRSQIEALVDKLIAHGPAAPDAAQWQADIDRIVYDLYGLTPDEIALVEQSGRTVAALPPAADADEA